MGVVGIDRFHCAEAGNTGYLRSPIETPAFERGNIMGKQANTMAVHTEPCAMHHGACRRIGRFVISAGGQENGAAKPLQLIQPRQDGGFFIAVRHEGILPIPESMPHKLFTGRVFAIEYRTPEGSISPPPPWHHRKSVRRR
ncbi:hypothetical protein D3C86_1401700 [compost metagenome]